MKVYQCPQFSVSNGFFRGLRVHEKSSGNTIKPNNAMSQRCSQIWVSIERTRDLAPEIKHVAKSMLFHDFGCIVLGLCDDDQIGQFEVSPIVAAQHYAVLAQKHQAQVVR